MIVVDSSALVAILENEPEGERFIDILREAPRRLVSAVTVSETAIVIGARRGRERAGRVMELLDELGIETVPFAEPISSGRLMPISAMARASIRKRDESWRLRVLRIGQRSERAAAVQGRDFSATDVLQGA